MLRWFFEILMSVKYKLNVFFDIPSKRTYYLFLAISNRNIELETKKWNGKFS